MSCVPFPPGNNIQASAILAISSLRIGPRPALPFSVFFPIGGHYCTWQRKVFLPLAAKLSRQEQPPLIISVAPSKLFNQAKAVVVLRCFLPNYGLPVHNYSSQQITTSPAGKYKTHVIGVCLFDKKIQCIVRNVAVVFPTQRNRVRMAIPSVYVRFNFRSNDALVRYVMVSYAAP